MSVSPVHAHGSATDGDRQSTASPYFPRISGANTIARPSPLQTAIEDDSFPSVRLQAKMVKQTPLPYQTQEFKPCIVLKKFEPSVRVSDTFVPGVPGDDVLGEFKKKRTVILHTDRYSHHGQLKLESSDSQKIRLAQEGQMLEDARSRMRLREALAHRARHDLHLGGNPVAPADEADEDGEARSKRRRRPRKPRKRPTDLQQQQQQPQMGQQRLQQLQHQQMLGFIPEEAESANVGGSGGHVRGRGQLVSHSSAPSIPALNLGAHLMQHRAPGQASFVSRSEFDALSALIGDPQQLQLQQQSPFGGLEKVKLDGSKAVFNQRSDILAELSRLKGIILPDFAKDLYVGRGIRLPGTHGLNNPRRVPNDDPILDALLRRAQQPTRIIDESGNILISAGSNASSDQERRGVRQVFAADVTVKPKTAEVQAGEQQEPPPQRHRPPHLEGGDVTATDEQPEPQLILPPLSEPFLGLSSEWGQSEDAVAVADEHGDSADEPIRQLQLPAGIADYLRAILAASNHPKTRSLTLELGRLIGQRLQAGGGGEGVADSKGGVLIGWLRRGLDLFHDVDREGKGAVSLPAFFDILSSMRGQPIEEAEAASVREAYGLSGDSVSKFAFLTVLPLLQNVLNRRS